MKTTKELIAEIDPTTPGDSDLFDPLEVAEEIRKFKAQVKKILETASGYNDGIWRS